MRSTSTTCRQGQHVASARQALHLLLCLYRSHHAKEHEDSGWPAVLNVRCMRRLLDITSDCLHGCKCACLLQQKSTPSWLVADSGDFHARACSSMEAPRRSRSCASVQRRAEPPAEDTHCHTRKRSLHDALDISNWATCCDARPAATAAVSSKCGSAVPRHGKEDSGEHTPCRT